MMAKPRKLMVALAVMFVVAIASVALAQTTTTADQTTTDQTSTDLTTAEQTTTEQTTTEQTTTYYEEDGDDDRRDDAVACGICGGIGLIFFVLPLAISIGIAWWIYRDATRAGNPQAVLWAVLGFLFNIIGLIIYLIARPKGPPTTIAPPPPV